MSQNMNKGGEFLIRETTIDGTFIPEDFNEEQNMMASAASDFVETEVRPNEERIEKQEPGLTVELMNKAGALGLLGTSIPEEFGGFGKDFVTNMLLTEHLGAAGSFAVSIAAHTGIGTLPILYFGNENQKKKYLPLLGSGEWKASYCLTEPGSGSDALAAKTKAVLSEDGKHYMLNGQKMWITNAGFADLFVVFAQVQTPAGAAFTGFIVEKSYAGISLGEEEHKMGIKGSSTRQVFFTDCPVPAENVLGEIGKGHLIAFNILNIGRAKLAAAALGATKKASSNSVKYANERIQFKLPISKFGAIKHKLAEQAIRIFALETATYRVAHLIDEKEKSMMVSGTDFAHALLGAAEEYAVECAILKVFGSEVLDFVVDEGVQIYGGMGYSADAPMERAYRDSRINRIFEGTNEINRMLIIDMLLRRAMKGSLDLMGAASTVQAELMAIPDFGATDDSLFAAERKAITGMKKATLMVAGTAVQKYMLNLAKEQEVMMHISDMIIESFVCESLLLRVEKLVSRNGEQAHALHLDMLRVQLSDAMERLGFSGRQTLAAMSDGDEQRMLLMGLKRFTKLAPFNTKDARRRVAAKLIEEGKFCF